MYKNYGCPTCGATRAFPSADAPVLQPASTMARCFGRLVFESETPYPPAPGPAPVLTAEEIANATSTLVTDRDGTRGYCSFRRSERSVCHSIYVIRSKCDERSVNQVNWYHVTVTQSPQFTRAKKGAA